MMKGGVCVICGFRCFCVGKWVPRGSDVENMNAGGDESWRLEFIHIAWRSTYLYTFMSQNPFLIDIIFQQCH